MHARLLRHLLALLGLGLLVLGAARAASLASLRGDALPPWPAAAAPQQLLAVQGRLLALRPDAAWVLDETTSQWQPVTGPLPQRPLAAAAGLSPQQPAVLLQQDSPGTGPRAVAWRWQGDTLVSQALPALPPGLRADPKTALVALHGQTVTLYAQAAGGALLQQLRLDDLAAGWRAVPTPPSPQPVVALLTQASVIVLLQRPAGSTADRLWRYSADKGWADRGDVPGRVLDGAGRSTGQAHVLLPLQAADGPRWMTWQTITGSWATLPGVADLPVVSTAAATPWKAGVAWIATDGSARQVQIQAERQLLKLIDWIVIVVYLVSMLGIGLYFYLREKRNSTSDFFVGGRTIPFWAAGVSLYAANTSSISYIAIPAKAFESNWTYMTNNLVAVLGLMFVAVWIVPLLRRLDLMSVFHYLEIRFHPAIRMLASALCMAVQVGSRMSVVLFLPALAIATITGLDVVWSVLLMGGFTIVYTAMGGMKAVVWTDIVQLVVKMGGALFAIGFIVWHLDGGLPELARVAAAADKTKLLDFSFDLTKATVWGFIFLVLFDVVLTFPKDQVLMQRVLSTPSDKEAGRSIWAFAVIMIPGGFVFYGIGTALYAYYQAHPERMNPLLGVDATFPLFIAAELPAGLTGLIIAGVFAAAMATLSSIMNSVATLASVDFYERLVKNPDPKKSVRFAELMTVVTGLAGIGVALLLSRYDIQSLFDVSIELAGLLGGGFAGAYTLGMFSRRANSPGVAIGIASAIVLTTWAWSVKLVHPYFYLGISILLCIVIGWCASWLFPAPTRSLVGLTLHRQDAGRHDKAAPRT